MIILWMLDVPMFWKYFIPCIWLILRHFQCKFYRVSTLWRGWNISKTLVIIWPLDLRKYIYQVQKEELIAFTPMHICRSWKLGVHRALKMFSNQTYLGSSTKLPGNNAWLYLLWERVFKLQHSVVILRLLSKNLKVKLLTELSEGVKHELNLLIFYWYIS